MAPDIRLLVTDLDGTLIGSANEFPLYETFKARLDELRQSHQTCWVACTGRTRQSFNAFFYPMRAMGLLPDFIILNHAFIFVRTPMGYMPRVFWNLHIYHMVMQQRMYARAALKHWRDMVTGAAAGVRMADRTKDQLRLQFDSEESATMAGNILRDKLSTYSHLRVFTYLREVEVRPVPFTKGLAVSELARRLGFDPDHVIAIGNGHNDISMFEPDVARMCGCVANSEAEVMRVVHEAGGHVAAARSLTGVLEILAAYAEDRVSSELPDSWVPPPKSNNPHHHRRKKKGRRSTHELKMATFWLVVGVVYVTLIVLAYFGILPFADDIMKPFSLLGQGLQRLLDSLYR